MLDRDLLGRFYRLTRVVCDLLTLGTPHVLPGSEIKWGWFSAHRLREGYWQSPLE